MNAIPDQSSLVVSVDSPDWQAIFDEINLWRGRCLHHYTVAEAAVTQTLEALAGVAAIGSPVPLRHSVGQRFEDLAKLIGPEGPFASQGAKASKSLDTFRNKQLPFRAMLCHGRAKSYVGRSGKWVVVMTKLSLVKGAAQTETKALEQAEALQLEIELKRDTLALADALGKLRKAVATR